MAFGGAAMGAACGKPTESAVPVIDLQWQTRGVGRTRRTLAFETWTPVRSTYTARVNRVGRHALQLVHDGGNGHVAEVRISLHTIVAIEVTERGLKVQYNAEPQVFVDHEVLGAENSALALRSHVTIVATKHDRSDNKLLQLGLRYSFAEGEFEELCVCALLPEAVLGDRDLCVQRSRAILKVNVVRLARSKVCDVWYQELLAFVRALSLHAEMSVQERRASTDGDLFREICCGCAQQVTCGDERFTVLCSDLQDHTMCLVNQVDERVDYSKCKRAAKKMIQGLKAEDH
jgi:hypothetical protein